MCKENNILIFNSPDFDSEKTHILSLQRNRENVLEKLWDLSFC